MVQQLPPVQSNQQLVDPKTGFGRPPFILLINNLISQIINTTTGIINAFFATKPTGVAPITTTGTYGTGVSIGFSGGLSSLNDVSFSTPPTDKQVLTYVGADSKWEAKASTGGSGVVGEAAWKVDATGTGSSQNITIPDNNPTLQSIIVSINGIRQPTTLYTISGTTVTLTATSSGDDIEIVGPVGDGTSAPFLVTATGTGVSQNITLPLSGLTPQSVLVYADGIRYPISQYAINGTTLTLTSNASGDGIEIIGPLGAASAGGGGYERTRKVPIVANFTHVNGAATLTNTTYGLQQVCPNAGTIDFLAQTATIPAAPYSMIVRAESVNPISTSGYKACLIARNVANNKLVIFGTYSNDQYLLQTFSGFGSFSSNISPSTTGMIRPLTWLRMDNDGTNLTFFTSVDGVAWAQTSTVTIATAIGATPDQIGFGTYTNGSVENCIFQSYEVA